MTTPRFFRRFDKDQPDIEIDSKTEHLVVTLVMKNFSGISSVGDHAALIVEDPVLMTESKGNPEKGGRYVINYGYTDDTMGTGLMKRIGRDYDPRYRVQFTVKKTSQCNIPALHAHMEEKEFYPSIKETFNPMHNCSAAVKEALNFLVPKEPTTRLIKRTLVKATCGLMSFFTLGCLCPAGSCCSRCIPAGPGFVTPYEVYKQALGIAVDQEKRQQEALAPPFQGDASAPNPEVMQDGYNYRPLEARTKDLEKVYKRGCIS